MSDAAEALLRIAATAAVQSGTETPAGVQWSPDARQVTVSTQDLADIVLSDPHIEPVLEQPGGPIRLPAADELPSPRQFFALWYRRGANHPDLRAELRRVYSATGVSPFAEHFGALARRRRALLPDRGDLVTSFIEPYSLHSTFRFMGFPESQWAGVATCYRVITRVLALRGRNVLDLDAQGLRAFHGAVEHLRSVLAEQVAGDNDTPLIDALRRYDRKHGSPPWADAATVAQLLVAGVPQIRTGIAVTCRTVLLRPALVEQVRLGELPVEHLAEEAMRLTPPFLGIFGWVRQTCDCLGVRLEPGWGVTVDIPSVNRDPHRVDEPLAIRASRPPDTVYTFGKGAHYCLGATLARSQVAAAVAELLRDERWRQADPSMVELGSDGFANQVRRFPYGAA